VKPKAPVREQTHTRDELRLPLAYLSA